MLAGSKSRASAATRNFAVQPDVSSGHQADEAVRFLLQIAFERMACNAQAACPGKLPIRSAGRSVIEGEGAELALPRLVCVRASGRVQRLAATCDRRRREAMHWSPRQSRRSRAEQAVGLELKTTKLNK